MSKGYRFSPMQTTATRECRECGVDRGQHHKTWCVTRKDA